MYLIHNNNIFTCYVMKVLRELTNVEMGHMAWTKTIKFVKVGRNAGNCAVTVSVKTQILHLFVFFVSIYICSFRGMERKGKFKHYNLQRPFFGVRRYIKPSWVRHDYAWTNVTCADTHIPSLLEA